MGKATILTKLRRERERLEATLAAVDAGRMTEPGVQGDWAVKDIFVHLAV